MTTEDSQQLARAAVEWALDKKAEDVVLLDLRGVLDVTDWFVIATGFSEIQVQAIADAVVDRAVERGEKPVHVEGRDAGRWVLVDFIDVVVHVMLPQERDRYRLDRLWGDAGLVAFDDTGASRVVRPPAHDPATADDTEGEDTP
jgi:ribosome-associated protein